MKSVYISGKITGEKDYKKHFDYAEMKIKKMGYRPINPTKYGDITGYKWHDYLKQDIKLLCDCDYIYQLPNWQESKGAKFEAEIAKNLHIPTLKIILSE